jgi:ubiquinone/menaquinone biosynthesis C-methylase UbiE
MDNKAVFYPESKFGGFTSVDGTVAFYNRVHALLCPGYVLLDYGCGRGALADDPLPYRRDLRIFKGKASRVIGVDLNPQAASNPYIDEFRLIETTHWPVSDQSIDLCTCDSVLEHVEFPESFFAEAKRVLKPGGYLCFRTSNLWGYPALIARLMPNQVHLPILKKVKPSLIEQDIFPTFYRCNTLPVLRRLLRENGFEHAVYGYGTEPSYLSFSRFAYWLGALYQKLAPGFLQPVIFGFARSVS